MNKSISTGIKSRNELNENVVVVSAEYYNYFQRYRFTECEMNDDGDDDDEKDDHNGDGDDDERCVQT